MRIAGISIEYFELLGFCGKNHSFPDSFIGNFSITPGNE
jgi:hypothetical protein